MSTASSSSNMTTTTTTSTTTTHPPIALWRRCVVDGAIHVLWILLTALDAVLVVALGVHRHVVVLATVGTNKNQQQKHGNDASSSTTSQGQQQQQALLQGSNTNDTPPTQQQRVVIVGASFAGLAVRHGLFESSRGPAADDNDGDLEITLVDAKPYFEYVPGVLRCFVDPHHFWNISSSLSVLQQQRHHHHSSTTTKLLIGHVTAVTRDSVTVVPPGGNRPTTCVPFDALVLATGSTYLANPMIKDQPARSRRERRAQWQDAHAAVQRATTIVVVGAGAVGVELVAELAEHQCCCCNNSNNNKRLLLVDLAPTVLPGFRPDSIRHATRWLQRHGVELHLGRPLPELTDTAVTLANGERIVQDDKNQSLLIYKCVGAQPNAARYIQGGPLECALNDKGALRVNDHLQLIGNNSNNNDDTCFENIFAAGDCIHHAASDERKLGHTAEVNGHLVAANVRRLLAAKNKNNNTNNKTNTPQSPAPPLLGYPDDVVGHTVTPQIYNISLGKYNATLALNALCLHGVLAAIVKWLLEWTKVAAAQERPVGILFWQVADGVSNWLGRTLLPTPVDRGTVVVPTTTTGKAARKKSE